MILLFCFLFRPQSFRAGDNVIEHPLFYNYDRKQAEPYDGYWHFGNLLLGRFGKINNAYIKEHARVWFIKGFFIPTMLEFLLIM